MRTSRLLAIAILLATSVKAQTVIPMGQFRSIELHSGGSVIVRHGSTQRVTILSGDLRCSQVRLAGGQRLVIENHIHQCPRDHRLQVEVITPEITAVSVSDGGTLRADGAFPAQSAIEADVENGGTIDIRSIAADAVDASVYSGGRIFTNPRATLAGSVESGGIITYWGDVRVRKSVRDGGIVLRGTPEDAEKAFSDLCPIAPIPPIPPVPPLTIRPHHPAHPPATPPVPVPAENPPLD